ncbi:hypothetical protein K7X08_025892 [Anisodus acutangulus]|uniref:IPO4/5-like TPR repeats domain-containing protein n=1 Tax=Anisodus acutangulus TaxID=402998 RepID=A0A9Q1RUM6_9SOLA|nr:hypothetical protein K7X08_025892 [Anisodus acutangulus]
MSEVRFRIIYRLATLLLPDNNWPELLPFLYQCLTDSTLKNYFKVSAFSIFAKLAGDIGETIVVPSANTLHSVFSSTLNDDTLDLELRITAMRAVIRFIQHMSSSNEKEHFQDLLLGMMKTLSKGEDDPAWHSAETASDITGITLNYCVGTTCLARFSLALGGKSIAHVAIEQLSAYSAAPEWEKRHAQIAQGCLKVLCYGEDLATEETVNRMINVLRNLQQTLPPDITESAWSYILPRQEMELKSLLSPKEDANF